jgi:hypothetical protein
MKTLIVHPGAGKTGSTSIQRFLLQQSEDLAKTAIVYMGMSFENTSLKTTQVGSYSGLAEYKHLLGAQINENPLKLEQQCAMQINSTLEEFKDSNVFVWSNESLVNMHSWFRGLRNRLDSDLHIKVIYGLRNPAEWAVSAYLQWGRDQDFKNFVLKRSIAGPAREWQDVSDTFAVIRIDKVDNLIGAFSETMGYLSAKNIKNVFKNKTGDRLCGIEPKSKALTSAMENDGDLIAWVSKEEKMISSLLRLDKCGL